MLSASLDNLACRMDLIREIGPNTSNGALLLVGQCVPEKAFLCFDQLGVTRLCCCWSVCHNLYKIGQSYTSMFLLEHLFSILGSTPIILSVLLSISQSVVWSVDWLDGQSVGQCRLVGLP